MTKAQIVRMHNGLADTLIEIKDALTDMLKSNGGVWLSNCDDSGMVQIRYQDQVLKFSGTQWFIEGEEVPFFKFLAAVMQE